MIEKDEPPKEGRVITLTKEIIKGGLRIRHPSGVSVDYALSDLQKLKEFCLSSISLFQEQLNLVDADIARIEAKQKA